LSKITERLTKLGQTERSGFGFGARATSTKVPVILIGISIKKASDAANVDADLFILAADSKGAPQATAVKDAEIWGVSISGGSAKEIDAAVEAGADFVIAEGESATGAALRDDDTAKGFVVSADVTEDRAKAIEAGPFEFLVLDGTGLKLPFNVGTVLDIQEQLARYSCHIFLNVTEVPDQINLELLRDIGISALIYDGGSISSEDLATLRKTIDLLEPKKQKSSAGATIPRAGESSAQDDDDDQDHDHDLDDDDWE
jgi:hypothetical protein